MTVLAPPSVLLIDDEDYLIEPLADAFEDEGMGLDTARDWSSGMGLFQVVGHELVIADYDLQDAKTGLQLLAEVKVLAPSTRLVLISGRLDETAIGLVRDAAVADAFLERTQPDFLARLLDEGRRAVQRAAQTDWQAVGTDYPRGENVNLRAIKRLEESLRLHVRRGDTQ